MFPGQVNKTLRHTFHGPVKVDNKGFVLFVLNGITLGDKQTNALGTSDILSSAMRISTLHVLLAYKHSLAVAVHCLELWAT